MKSPPQPASVGDDARLALLRYIVLELRNKLDTTTAKHINAKLELCRNYTGRVLWIIEAPDARPPCLIRNPWTPNPCRPQSQGRKLIREQKTGFYGHCSRIESVLDVKNPYSPSANP